MNHAKRAATINHQHRFPGLLRRTTSPHPIKHHPAPASTATYVEERPTSNCDRMATNPTIAPTGGRIQPRRRESWSNTPSSSHLTISTDRGLTPYDEEGLLRCAEAVGARTVPTRVRQQIGSGVDMKLRMALIVISALVAAGCGDDAAQTAVDATA